jgi:hypothetical protein
MDLPGYGRTTAVDLYRRFCFPHSTQGGLIDLRLTSGRTRRVRPYLSTAVESQRGVLTWVLSYGCILYYPGTGVPRYYAKFYCSTVESKTRKAKTVESKTPLESRAPLALLHWPPTQVVRRSISIYRCLNI